MNILLDIQQLIVFNEIEKYKRYLDILFFI